MPPVPVIVGCGLTGCAISRSLSRAGIRHVLVGPAPRGDGPRLGESLNLEGSLDILDYFPELSQHYLSKAAVNAHIGDMEIRCDLNMQRGRGSAAFYAALGYKQPPDAFLHVDRKGFDAAVFESVRKGELCEHVEDLVDGVDFDAAGDRVRALKLGGGATLEPSVVFDATNHVRAVARHLGLNLEVLGGPQRAAYGHGRHIGPVDPDDPVWHATHIVRLDRGSDGVDALAWFIPLRGEASIGVGLDVDENGGAGAAISDERLVALALLAMERRGIVPAGVFEVPAQVRSVPRYFHFVHDRAWGANWLLAGGTFCLMSFAASAGVSSGFAAANCAPSFITDARRYGPRYEKLLSELRAPHAVFDWLCHVDPDEADLAELERKGDVLVEQSVLRLAMAMQLRPGLMRNTVARGLAGAIRADLFDAAGICVHAQRREQDDEAREAACLQTLGRVLAIFSGSAPLDEIGEHVHDDVVVHIDRLRFSGLGGWKKWARHSHATWPFDALRFEVTEHTFDPARDALDVTIVAADGDRRSEPAQFTYRFEGGRVREIWTSRRNYTFLYGARFARLPGFLAHVGRLWWWNVRNPA